MRFYPLTIKDIIDETYNAKSFLLKPQAADAELFKYQSGQFLTFRVALRGADIERCYSLTSTPQVDSGLKITVKKVASGLVSNFLNDRLQVGDTIATAKPNGRFVLHHASNPILFFACGSGITPIISLIKKAIYTSKRAVYLLYANRNQQSIIFYNQIQQLSKEHPDRFHCQYHLSEQSGRLTANTVSSFIRDIKDGHIYICGPEPVMSLIETVAKQHSFDQNNIFIERFSAPYGERKDNKQPPAITAPLGVSQFRVTLDEKTHQVPYIQHSTLLECLLSAGLDPAHLCKDAHCGSCMAVIKAGHIEMRKTTCLSKRDLSRNYILLCQAIPQSKDVWIDCDA